LWDLTQNPWVVLQTVSREKLQRILDDPVFRKDVDDQLQAKRQSASEPAWFQKISESALALVIPAWVMLSEACLFIPAVNVPGIKLKQRAIWGSAYRRGPSTSKATSAGD
jgi:hypothetical protein